MGHRGILMNQRGVYRKTMGIQVDQRGIQSGVKGGPTWLFQLDIAMNPREPEGYPGRPGGIQTDQGYPGRPEGYLGGPEGIQVDQTVSR